MKFKLLTISVFILLSSTANAFHTCSGKVLDIITRATAEDTKVRIENMEGFAKLGYYEGDDENEARYLHERQFAMIMAAFLADQTISLEFVRDDLSCSDSHSNELIRYVRMRR